MISKKISHYIITDKLGSGGMGEVYLAMDTLLNRRVAIKVLPNYLASDLRANQYFKREAQAAAELDHPNICTIYEVGGDNGRDYIAMQYIEGETLTSIIKRQSLSIPEVISIACQLANALAAAHSVGIIHRDIKPHNIMLTSKGHLKVLDFGLATRLTSSVGAPADLCERRLAPGSYQVEATAGPKVANYDGETLSLLSEPGVLVGTVPYMSPEQVKCEVLDVRTDVFSFGSVIFEAITGSPLFAKESAPATIASILNDPATIPPDKTEQGKELLRILQKCLEKDRNDRYQSAVELAAELNDLRRKSEVGVVANTAREPKASSFIAKLIAFTLTILLMFAIGFVAFFWNAKQPPQNITAKLSVDSIAVLPLRTTGDDSNKDYLGDGITLSLINQLSQISNLKVVARNSVFRYKDQEIDPKTVGQQLNVTTVLTGRIEQKGDDLTVHLMLTDARQNNVIWSRQFSSKRQDVLGLQSDILREVIEEVRPQAAANLRTQFQNSTTQNIEAYNQYLKGLFYLYKRTPADLRTALESFQKAVKIDPNYALAYSGLADAYSLLDDFSLEPPSVSMPLAENAARKALAINPDLAEAHSTLGLIYRDFKFDWPAAEQELKRALELNPNYAVAHNRYGWYLISMGRFDEALMYMRKAQELDPRSLNMNTAIGLPYYYSRRYEKAIEEFQRTLQLDPSFYPANFYLGLAYVKVGRFKEAIEIFKKLRKIDDSPDMATYLGYAYAAAGQKDETRKVLRYLIKQMSRSYVPPYDIALTYAQLGKSEQAMFWLEKALENHELSSVIKVEPMLDPLRNNPRFQALLQRIKLAD